MKMKIAGSASKPKADYPEGDCLKPFKGQRAGAMRAGSTKIAGYPDESKEGNGHPGAHQA